MLGENLSSTEAIYQVQFGSSGLTNLMALKQGMKAAHVSFTSVVADPSLQVKGVCTPMELCTFMPPEVPALWTRQPVRENVEGARS